MKTLLQSLRLLAFFTILTGLLYPLLTTGLATVIAKDKANGSMIQVNGQVIGSRLIGQKFATSRYFHSRPSAVDYNPLPSGGTNLGPTSKKLLESVSAAKTEWGSTA
ncbi:MAG: potassium-transporting ATPase subunit C, partial [Proteobacteria bacterium]